MSRVGNPFASRAGRHPLAALFVLAFGSSWLCWLAPALGYRSGVGPVLYVLGGFGPLVAGATMWIGAAVLIARTHGRIGQESNEADADPRALLGSVPNGSVPLPLAADPVLR